MRSDGVRWINKPRTISSSVRRDQSSASFFSRNVLTVVGHPAFRMTAFQVPEGVLTTVAMYAPVLSNFAYCTEIVPMCPPETKKGLRFSPKSLILLVGLS